MLQKNGKLYGPKNALQLDNESSCWNSDAGETQWYTVEFHRPVTMTEIRLQFQAGFSAETGHVDVQYNVADNNDNNNEEEEAYKQSVRAGSSVGNKEEWKRLDNEELELEDALGVQTFRLEQPVEDCCKVRIVFEECTDFYGRVTLYQVQVWGHEQQQEEDDGKGADRAKPRENEDKGEE